MKPDGVEFAILEHVRSSSHRRGSDLKNEIEQPAGHVAPKKRSFVQDVIRKKIKGCQVPPRFKDPIYGQSPKRVLEHSRE